MENVSKALDDVIKYITESNEYKECISLKEQMSDNTTINDLINKIKDTQKKYIRSGYSENIKKELDNYEEELMNIPIYYSYNKSLEKVNEMINCVKDTINDYFDELLNKKKN